jgi:hypothetical protein
MWSTSICGNASSQVKLVFHTRETSLRATDTTQVARVIEIGDRTNPATKASHCMSGALDLI